MAKTDRRRSREERIGWVEKWKASGLSGTQFAKRHGLSIRSLYGWRQRLEAEASASETTQAFVPVRIRKTEPERVRGCRSGSNKPSPDNAGTSGTSGSLGTIEVVACGGRTIRVVGQVDIDQLRAVIEAVERC